MSTNAVLGWPVLAVREKRGLRGRVIHVDQSPASEPRGSEWDGQWGPFQVKSGRQGNMERAPGGRTWVLYQEQEIGVHWNSWSRLEGEPANLGLVVEASSS